MSAAAPFVLIAEDEQSIRVALETLAELAGRAGVASQMTPTVGKSGE
jgi:hypothetical protein